MASARGEWCSCGSGKKFKNCCGAERKEFAFPSDHARQAITRRLVQHLGESASSSELERAAEQLAGGRSRALRPEVGEIVTINTTSYLIHDADLRGKGTVVEGFLAEHGARLAATERRYLEALRDTYIGLYEVSDVVLDEGFRLNDLLGGGEIWVRERKATHYLVRWSILGARVLLDPSRGEGTFVGDLYPLPQGHKAEFVRSMRVVLGLGSKRRLDPVAMRAELKKLGPLFFQAWWDLTLFPPLPQVTNFDGHAVLPTTTTYEVTDVAALRARLATVTEFEAGGDDEWAWLREIQGARRVVARLTLDGGRLELETNSRERTETARALLEERLGGLLRFRSSSESDVSAYMERVRAEGGGGPARNQEPPDPAGESLRLEVLDEQYRKWVDEPIPALDLRTPREAAKLKSQRARVADLIKGIEILEAQHARSGGRPYDCSWMWSELGLEAPR